MTQKLNITKEFLDELDDNVIWRSPVDFRTPFTQSSEFRIVYCDKGEDRRWSRIDTYIVQRKSDGSFHQFHKDIGLTENQENGDLYYDGPVTFEAKTITQEVFIATPIKE